MLGISFGEILIIGTIGLIVIGPKRLPETARFLGHLFGRMQRQVNSVKADIRREMALEDMKNIHREYQDTARDVKNAFDQAATGVPPPEELLGGNVAADAQENNEHQAHADAAPSPTSVTKDGGAEKTEAATPATDKPPAA